MRIVLRVLGRVLAVSCCALPAAPRAHAQAPAFVAPAQAAGEQFGAHATRIQDRNGDGVPEILAGAPNASPLGQTNAGAVAVLDGKTGVRLQTVPNVTALERLGASLLELADLNGDSVPEIVAGVPGAGGLAQIGGLRVLDGQTLLSIASIPGPAAGGRLGAKLVRLDDLNGDGVAEIAASAPGLPGPGGSETGAVLVIDVKTGTTLRTLSGAAASDTFGTGLASIPDLSGDGLRDLLIGIPGFDPAGSSGAGRVACYDPVSGALVRFRDGTAPNQSFGFACAAVDDLDFDGVPDVVVGAPGANVGTALLAGEAHVLSGANFAQVHLVQGSGANDRLGTVVAGLGDLDQDGRGEFAVGSPFASPLGVTEGGELRVYEGNASILYVFLGAVPQGGVGGFVANAGDVDGDGRIDFFQGDPGHDSPGTNAGRLILRRGQVGHLTLTGAGQSGTPFTYALQAEPLQWVVLLIDGAAGMIPSPYGTICLAFTPALQVVPFGSTDLAGFQVVASTLPGVPFPVTVHVQALVSEPSGAAGWRASSCAVFPLTP